MDQQEFARNLRRNMTDAERLLWRHLRARRLDGQKFRRQHPVGPYVVDFAHIAARVIVEADGGQHNGSAGDRIRDEWLQAQGFRVLRFWNNEILCNTEAVLEEVWKAVSVSLTPTPLPQAGEGLKRMTLTPTPLPQAGEGLKRMALTPTPLPPAGEGLTESPLSRLRERGRG